MGGKFMTLKITEELIKSKKANKVAILSEGKVPKPNYRTL